MDVLLALLHMAAYVTLALGLALPELPVPLVQQLRA